MEGNLPKELLISKTHRERKKRETKRDQESFWQNFLVFVRERERLAFHFKGASMARIPLGELDPTAGIPSWVTSLVLWSWCSVICQANRSLRKISPCQLPYIIW